MPKTSPYGISRPSGWSGTVLGMQGTAAANLKYRDVETAGRANISATEGTIRFWFKPDWQSGTGPGAWGRFIELGDATPSGGWWALSINPIGTAIRFETQMGGAPITHMEADGLNWTLSGNLVNDWHEITLTYGASMTKLYIDGNLAASGSGALNWPSDAARASSGLNVGSNRNGTGSVKGQIDELETFGCVLGPEDVQLHYAAMILSDGKQSTFQLRLSAKSTRQNYVTAWFDGTPSGLMGVLVNPGSFENSVWQSVGWMPTPSLFNVALGSGDGTRQVWVGVKGLGGQSHWVMTEVTVDTTAPDVTIDGANPLTTSQPVIQITGQSSEWLSAVTCDVQNASGVFMGQTAVLRPHGFDTATGKLLPSTQFQCYDVELAEGLNTLTLHVEDLAGNVSVRTLQCTFDLQNDHTAPNMTVHWPLSGASVAANEFTLRGVLDDPTATISVDGLGKGSIQGVVERNGDFWVEHLPLVAGVNAFTITAKDVKGNANTANWSLNRSSLSIGINPIPENELPNPFVDVTGFIIATDHTLWVNGVKATWVSQPQASPWTWKAISVPLNKGGTAIVQARAIPNSDNNGGQTAPKEPFGGGTLGNPLSAFQRDAGLEPEKPPAWYVARYTSDIHWQWNYCGVIQRDTPFKWEMRTRWEDGGPEHFSELTQWFTPWQQFEGGSPGCNESVTRWDWPAEHWPRNRAGGPTLPGTESRSCDWEGFTPYSGDCGPPCIPFERCAVFQRWTSDDTECASSTEYTRSASTQILLETGGKYAVRGERVYAIHATAAECLDPYYVQGCPLPDPGPSTKPIPGPGIRILDKPLDNSNFVYVSLRDRHVFDITPHVSVDYYHFGDISVTPITIKQLQFGGANKIAMTADPTGAAFVPPEWLDASSPPDGDADDVGDRRFPVAFVANSMITAQPTLRSAVGVGSDLEIIGFARDLKGTHLSYFGPAALGSALQDGTQSTAPLACSQPLADTIDCLDPLKINWSIRPKGTANWLHIGDTANRVYVTLAATTGSPCLKQTVLHLSCKNAKGLKTPDLVVDSIYGEFTDQDVRRLGYDPNLNRDVPKKMTYWAGGDRGARDVSGLLERADANGNCEAWSAFFRDCLRVQGIQADRCMVQSTRPAEQTDSSGLLVKNVSFTGNGSQPGEYAYEWGVDAIPGNGIAGQGNPNPDKPFNVHYVVEYPGLPNPNPTIYDPSYGTPKRSGTTRLLDYENAAFDGYFMNVDVRKNPIGTTPDVTTQPIP